MKMLDKIIYNITDIEYFESAEISVLPDEGNYINNTLNLCCLPFYFNIEDKYTNFKFLYSNMTINIKSLDDNISYIYLRAILNKIGYLDQYNCSDKSDSHIYTCSRMDLDSIMPKCIVLINGEIFYYNIIYLVHNEMVRWISSVIDVDIKEWIKYYELNSINFRVVIRDSNYTNEERKIICESACEQIISYLRDKSLFINYITTIL